MARTDHLTDKLITYFKTLHLLSVLLFIMATLEIGRKRESLVFRIHRLLLHHMSANWEPLVSESVLVPLPLYQHRPCIDYLHPVYYNRKRRTEFKWLIFHQLLIVRFVSLFVFTSHTSQNEPRHIFSFETNPTAAIKTAVPMFSLVYHISPKEKTWPKTESKRGRKFEAVLIRQLHTTSQWELFCWRAGWAGEVDQCVSEPPLLQAPAHLVSATSSKTPSALNTHLK